MGIEGVFMDDSLRDRGLDYMEASPWIGGASLARKVREGGFKENERILLALDGEAIVGYCSLTEKDLLPEGDYGPFIGHLFIDEAYRGRGLAGVLLDQAWDYVRGRGHKGLYLISNQLGLYERYGFRLEKDLAQIDGDVERLFFKEA